MQLEYETNRLVLRILSESDVLRSLAFYERNLDFFAPYDPIYPDGFLTPAFQQTFIAGQLKQFLQQSALRYHLLQKEKPDTIIGVVGFSSVSLGEERSCNLCYKLDQAMLHQGYATEAVSRLLQELSLSLSIHRVQADILPGNTPSIRLAQRLGFQYEGTARQAHKVNGQWQDHLRYAKILD